MRRSALFAAAAAALIGISIAAIPSEAQSQTVEGRAANRGPGGGGAPIVGGGGGSGFRRGGGGGGGSLAVIPGGGGGSFRGSGRRGGGGGGSAWQGGRGGWRGAGPAPRYYGGHRHHRGGGPGIALGAAALGLAAGAILGAPAYVDEPEVVADECMQQVWIRGAWRWRNVCD